MEESERRKSSLKLAENFVDPSDMPEDIKNDIKKHFPVYFGDDLIEITEEVITWKIIILLFCLV